MSDEIRVNGILHSWGSITVKINDERYTGFTSISYGDSIERSKAYGMGRSHAPRGRSRGKYIVEPVTLTGYKQTIQTLREALADAAGGDSYGHVQFQVVVEYTEPDESPITVELEDCVWAKNTSSEEESPDPLMEDIELDCMLIRRNGKVLFEPTEGAP